MPFSRSSRLHSHLSLYFSALTGLLSPLMADDLSSYGRAMGACPDFQRAMAGNLKPGSEEEDRRQKRYDTVS